MTSEESGAWPQVSAAAAVGFEPSSVGDAPPVARDADGGFDDLVDRLHQTIIEALYAVGLAWQSAAGDPQAEERIGAAVSAMKRYMDTLGPGGGAQGLRRA